MEFRDMEHVSSIFKSKAKIQCSHNRIVANLLDHGFVHYYRHLAYKEFPNLKFGLSLAKHSPHITIARKPLDDFDYQKAQKYVNLKVQFEYDPTSIYIGGFVRNFVGFYVKVDSPELEKIREDILLKPSQSSLHLSLFSTKKGNEKKEIKNI